MSESELTMLENELEGNEAVMHLQLKEKFKGSTKCDIIEQLITENSRLTVSYNNENYTVMIKDSDETEILGPFTIKLSEMGYNPTTVEQPILNLQREEIAPNVNVFMPRINGEKGLHLFLCPVAECTEMYVRVATAKLHALAHLNIKPYVCDYPGCRWSFYTIHKLARHCDTHLKRKDYECSVPGCGKRFTTMYNYKEHKKKHDLPAILECPVESCNKMFQNHKTRNDHIRTHERSEASFICPVETCNKRFFSAVTLQGHSKAHSHNLENLKCRVCGKVFSLPCRLKDHLIKHTGEKPHICSICQKGFRSSSKLKRHMAIHTNDRRYQCSICEKKFLRSETLKDHMDTHGSNLIKCKVCMEYFSKEELSRHAKTHKEVKPPEPSPQIDPNPSGDVLLEQAIQSLGVPSDIMLSSYIEEPTLDFLDSVDNESFSTVNLRDFGINV